MKTSVTVTTAFEGCAYDCKYLTIETNEIYAGGEIYDKSWSCKYWKICREALRIRQRQETSQGDK